MNPTGDRDDDLRNALHEAVSDIQPQGSLDQIRSRTDKVVPMNRRWFLPTIAVAAVMAAVIAGAFWMTRDDDPSVGPAASPSPTPSAGTPTQTAEPGLVERAVPVYFVGDTARGPKLFREFQSQEVSSGSAEDLAHAAAMTAVAGEPVDPDYSNPWPDSARELVGVAYDPTGDVLTIELSSSVHDRPAGMSQELAELAVEQLIYSAQAGLGKGRVPVQFILDGGRTDQVLGVPTSEPLATGDEDDVLAPVWINLPAEGASVQAPFEVNGVAMSFEATVVWQLKQGETVVEEGFTTAEECCTRSPYSFMVDVGPGTYTLVVQDDDPSGGEGPGVSPDTKEITVQ